MARASKRGRLTDIPTFAALRHRDYRVFWISSVLSGGAMWTLLVGRGWLVFHLSDSSLWVGITTFAAMIPFILVTPLGGLLADRVNRRNLVAVTFGVNFLLTVALTALFLSGSIEIWHVVALSLMSGVARAIEMPTMQALVPNLVPREDLLNAVVLTGMARQGSRLVGPGLAGPLLATVGVGGAFVIAALFYGLGTLQVLRVRTISRGEPASDLGVLRDMMAGLVYAYRHQMVGLFIIMVAFHCSLTMSFEALLPAFSRQVLNAGGATFSYLVMAVGGGALIGTLALAGVRDEKRKGQLLLLTGLASGVTPIALAASSSLPFAILSAAGMGACQAMFMAITNTYVQSIVPDKLRGRISSIYALHAGGIMALANLSNGFLADLWSAPPILIATGVAFVVALLAMSVVRPALRRVYRTGAVVTA